MALRRTGLLQVFINFLETVYAAQFDHFLLALLGQTSFVLPILSQKVDSSLDSVAPVGPCVAANRDVVGWAQLAVPILVGRHTVPGEEFRKELDILEHLFIEGECYVSHLKSSRFDRYL